MPEKVFECLHINKVGVNVLGTFFRVCKLSIVVVAYI